MAKVNRKQEVDIINAWQHNELSMADLGKRYSMSRQGIYKILRKAGCDVKKHRLHVSCNTCGKPVLRTRKQLRTRKHIFCNIECWRAWFKAISQYDNHSYGSRVAREKVRQYFDLQKGNIVHHLNGHGLDNALDNLVVLANQGDHLRMHRGFDVTPIWEGKTYTPSSTS